jgi:hypothetical protein
MLLNCGKLDGIQIFGRKNLEMMTANHIGERRVDLSVGPVMGSVLATPVRQESKDLSCQAGVGTLVGWAART